MTDPTDAILSNLSDDDVMYDHPTSQAGPMDPILFVRWDAIRAALAAQPSVPRTDDGLRTALRSLIRNTAGLPHGPCIDADAMEEVMRGASSDAPLDVAWAEAEAALPDGWVIESIGGGVSASGWVADAALNGSILAGEFEQGQGPTPAAALHALAARLAASTEGSTDREP